MVAIIRKLGQFRGDSRFTTWAYKFVVLEVSAQFGRRSRRHVTVQMGDDVWERIPDRLGIDPVRHAESVELVEALRAAVTGSLSERQRRVFVALAVDGVVVRRERAGPAAVVAAGRVVQEVQVADESVAGRAEIGAFGRVEQEAAATVAGGVGRRVPQLQEQAVAVLIQPPQRHSAG